MGKHSNTNGKMGPPAWTVRLCPVLPKTQIDQNSIAYFFFTRNWWLMEKTNYLGRLAKTCALQSWSQQWDCHKCSLALLDRRGWDVALVVPVSSKETFAHELEAHTWMIYDHMVTWGSNFSRERLRRTINMVSYGIHFLAILMLTRVPESQFLPMAISVHLL